LEPSPMTAPDPTREASAARGADRALRAAARHSGGRLAAAAACSVAAAGAALAEPAVLGHTLDLLLRQDPAGARWTAWCAAVIAAEVLLDAVTARLTGGVDARSTAWLRRLGLGRLLRAAPHHAARHSPGELSARLTSQATTAGAVPAAVVGAAVALLPPLGGLVALVLVDVWTALAFLAGLPLLALLLRAFARDSGASVSRYQEVQLAMAGRLVEALAGARTIAAAGTAEREQARVLRRLPELGAEGRRTWRIYGTTVARTSALMPLLLYVVLGVGGVRLAEGALGVGGLLAAVRYAGLAAGVGAVTGRLAAVVRGRAAARRTAALFDLPELPQGERRLPEGGPGTLELRGVRVVREGTEVLRDIDLRIPGGTTAAVVGRSGSGKTTLAAVAGRLTACDAGRVLLDGVPLDELSAGELRREVGHAFERPALFGEGVAAAIAFGSGPAPAPESVRAAARAAGADAFVRRLPQGYDTALADAPLSGGELQRLGLARAFCRAGRLLVLDDATSSLDTLTAREVERALAHDVRPGTRLVVAHRISAASRADLVVWLDAGRVRATGPHAELWRDPAYRAVFGAGAEPGGGREAEPAAATSALATAPAPEPPAAGGPDAQRNAGSDAATGAAPAWAEGTGSGPAATPGRAPAEGPEEGPDTGLVAAPTPRTGAAPVEGPDTGPSAGTGPAAAGGDGGRSGRRRAPGRETVR
ncbi:ATP-binding cassette domain-containing protein, partial [Streptomyces goshikiensis]|uniref:ATP-binding cassette domain-containing protein n=1 Tax=Streptomyces goshikiensis TaxID=1942 RepID=UPI00365D445C